MGLCLVRREGCFGWVGCGEVEMCGLSVEWGLGDVIRSFDFDDVGGVCFGG